MDCDASASYATRRSMQGIWNDCFEIFMKAAIYSMVVMSSGEWMRGLHGCYVVLC